MLISLLVGAFAAEPPCRITWAELAPKLDGIDAAWGISTDTFRAGMTTVSAQLPCLTEAIPPEHAARIHRAKGLEAFVDRDLDRARAAFAAAKAADPAYSFPVTMVPMGNPVRTLYDASTTSGATVPLPPPAKGAVRLDGIVSRARTIDRATLFQLERQPAVETRWLAPGDPAPAYRQRGQGFRLPLLLAGVAAAGAGTALYVVADGLGTNPPPIDSQADLDALGAQNHGLLFGAGGLGMAAAGCLTTAFVWGRW
ncbi:MAG: hypothetical protein Q8P18_34815 [Pseudomonadota bacterium]|nr:hypothetical protein [Pseudomonadota bacterium]